LQLNDDSIVFALLTGGLTGSVSLDQMLTDARIEFGNQVDGSNIIGTVHSHPASTGPGFLDISYSQMSDIDRQAVMPSHYNIGGVQLNPNTGQRVRDPLTNQPLLLQEMWDWGTAPRFLSRAGNSSPENISHYIVGPDGVLREFDYADQHPTERPLNEQNQTIENSDK